MFSQHLSIQIFSGKNAASESSTYILKQFSGKAILTHSSDPLKLQRSPLKKKPFVAEISVFLTPKKGEEKRKLRITQREEGEEKRDFFCSLSPSHMQDRDYDFFFWRTTE